MYQPQPRMAGTAGNGPQQFHEQNQAASTSVNAQFPASYSGNQVSNYPQNPAPQNHWNNAGAAPNGAPNGATNSAPNYPNGFQGYHPSGNPADFGAQQQHWQQQQQQQQSGSNNWSAPHQPGWNNNQSLKGANSSNAPANCDNYQRTFDYVQECQNWTTQ